MATCRCLTCVDVPFSQHAAMSPALARKLSSANVVAGAPRSDSPVAPPTLPRAPSSLEFRAVSFTKPLLDELREKYVPQALRPPVDSAAPARGGVSVTDGQRAAPPRRLEEQALLETLSELYSTKALLQRERCAPAARHARLASRTAL